jgi:methylornithine synthase
MNLDDVLAKSAGGHSLDRSEIEWLLSRTRAGEQVFACARRVRERNFGRKVFLYGFVYFSTYCRNECAFCYYRKSNKRPPRYRKTEAEITATARELAASGVHLIDLTMGEDPYYHEQPGELIRIIKAVKEAAGLPLMISPGVVGQETLEKAAQAGADWYALYQETHNQDLFARLRIGQDYQTRFSAKEAAQKCGMLIEEGLLTGTGDNAADAAASLEVMGRLRASQIRVMTFIPQAGTPMEHTRTGKEPDFSGELLTIAVMRLAFPGLLIPASLDVDGLRGLSARLNAGANVVTSIIPPRRGFAGVAHARAGIDEGYRTSAGIRETLKECGLEPAGPADYQNWLEARKKELCL